MKRQCIKNKIRLGELVWETGVYVSGALIVVVVVALFAFLAGESRYVLDRKFDVGVRLALLPDRKGEYEDELSLDPNSTVVTLNREGTDGLDEKEEVVPLAPIADMKGVAMMATGSDLSANLSQQPGDLYRDDWRAKRRADQTTTFNIYGFATPEYAQKTMRLAWEPDHGFVTNESPYNITLTLVKSPSGVDVKPFTIDLKRQPKGKIEIPAYVAQSDTDRFGGYVFQVTVTPSSGHFAAVARGVSSSQWEPTGAYQRYGFLPLLFGTIAMSIIAILLAAPLGVATAFYLAEQAPPRIREWLKPIVELLASVPTVVLGYFGLMLIVPNMGLRLANLLGQDSGRNLLSASIVLAVLLIPTIASMSDDALRAIPRQLRESGEAIGLTRFEILRNVVYPAAKPMLIGALLVGFARAIGETMVIWILSGGTANMPSFKNVTEGLATFVKSSRGIPDTVAIEMGNVEFEGVHYGHLFFMGLVLFALTMVINLLAQRIVRRAAWRS